MIIFKEKLKIFPSNEKLMSVTLSYVIIKWLFMCYIETLTKRDKVTLI